MLESTKIAADLLSDSTLKSAPARPSSLNMTPFCTSSGDPPESDPEITTSPPNTAVPAVTVSFVPADPET